MANFIDKQFGRMGNRLFQLAYIYAQFRDGNIPDIYLQDCKYFDKYRNELQDLFGVNKQGGNNAISIHVRRGSNPSNPEEPAYSDNPFYVNLMRTDYYEKAMEQFKEEKLRFWVFSDDIEWCKKQPIFKDCEFVSSGSEEGDFEWMARCKGHIIANSSFSYMAAYLGGGKTIYPKQWFSDGNQRVGFPSDWIVI